MDRAEHARQSGAIVRISFQLDQFAVERVEILVTFHEKLADNLIAHELATSGGGKQSATARAHRTQTHQTNRRATANSFNIGNFFRLLRLISPQPRSSPTTGPGESHCPCCSPRPIAPV